MPRSEKGMSACCTIVPTTPFWPCRLLNLSPTSGRRVCRSSACRRAAPRPSGACPQSAARRQPAVPGSRPQEATSAWPCCLTGYRVVAAGGRGALPPSASACKGRTTARRAAHLNRAGRDMAGQRAAAARLDDHVAVLVGGQQHLVHDHALPGRALPGQRGRSVERVRQRRVVRTQARDDLLGLHGRLAVDQHVVRRRHLTDRADAVRIQQGLAAAPLAVLRARRALGCGAAAPPAAARGGPEARAARFAALEE